MSGPRTSSSTPRYDAASFSGIAIDAARRQRRGRAVRRGRAIDATQSRRRRDTVTATPSLAGAREARPDEVEASIKRGRAKRSGGRNSRL